MWYLSFSVWLTLFEMIISRPIHVAASGIFSFFFMASQRHLTLTSWGQFVASSRKSWHPDTVLVADWPRQVTSTPEPHLLVWTERYWYWRLREEKGSACQTGDAGSIPQSRRSPGGGNGNPLQYAYSAWTEKPDGLQSLGLQRVGHDLATKEQHWHRMGRTRRRECLWKSSIKMKSFSTVLTTCCCDQLVIQAFPLPAGYMPASRWLFFEWST